MAGAQTMQQLTQALTSAGLPTPHMSFLQPILASNTRGLPLQSLIATARIRLLSADISSPSILHPSTPSLPANIADVKIISRKLDKDTVVQVLDIEDIGRSKWEEIEKLESERKGETTKGREVIRVVPADDVNPSSASTQALGTQVPANQGKVGPYKLLLQDCKGAKVYAFELKNVEKIGYPPGMGIGCKILLKRGCEVGRGMVLLVPDRVVVLGGRIEGLDKGWREGREERLRNEVNRTAGIYTGHGNGRD